MSTNMIVGALLTSVLQVGEVADVSNSAAYMPQTLEETTLFFNETDKYGITPVLVIDSYYLNDNNEYTYVDPGPLKDAIRDSEHIGKMLFMYDEPFLRGRRANQPIDDILEIMHQIKDDFPGVEFVHIESFAEIYWQKQENGGKLKLFLDADHIGFNCYGYFDKCGDLSIGVPELSQLQYLSDIYSAIVEGHSRAKLFLVPGAFMGGNMFYSDYQVVSQLYDYKFIANHYSDVISGFGVFIWGDYNGNNKGLIGARSLPIVKSTVLNILDELKNQ